MKGRKLVNRGRPAAARERYVYGAHAVAEWLRSRPEHVLRVHYERQARQRLSAIVSLATAARVQVEAATEEMLTNRAGTSRHQGVVAATRPFPYVELDELLSEAPRLLVLADQLQDPHNLGAVMRTAAAVGAGGIIIPKDGSVPITPTVEAAAAGAAARLPVCRVTNSARTLEALQEQGYWTIGLVPRQGIDLYEFRAPERVAVVVGGETGMRPLVAGRCDCTVSIPMVGGVESLNASVAAAVVVFELARQWRESRGDSERVP